MLTSLAARLSLVAHTATTTVLPPLAQAFHKFAVAHPPGDGQARTVTLIPGDGVGPEIAKSVVDVVEALHAPIIFERFDDFKGSSPSVPQEVIDSIRKNGVAVKGTLVTPMEKRKANVMSLNLQLRKELDFHVNLVHGISIPGLETRHEDIDIVVIRENTEGEYSGLEHEAVEGVIEALKVITYDKSLRTAQYAFEFALLNNREKVTAVHKANIMKLGDGMFLQACRSVAPQFPSIKFEEMIVDNTCMQLVNKPEQFDVMVTPNLYGNLVANVVAGLCGGPGVVPGANIGDGVALFEAGARHSARDLAGKGIANPTATLLSVAGMMHHVRLSTFAERLEEAILEVYAAGNSADLTPDVGGTGTLHSLTKAIIARLL